MNYILNVSSLASKFGFDDGDIFMDYCDEYKEFLVFVVKEKLLPLVPAESVYEIYSIHNPIRANPGWIDEARKSKVIVELSGDDLDELYDLFLLDYRGI